MNSKISYLYRDASNYKEVETVVISGCLSMVEIEPYLDCGTYFCPEDIGLPHPGHNFSHGNFPGEDDHSWCEIEEVEQTSDFPTMDATAQSLLELIIKASSEGWPAQHKEPVSECD